MKSIVYILSGFVLGFYSLCVLLQYEVYSNFKFDEKPRSFNVEETEFIHKNICTIMGKIKNPEFYYINNIRLVKENLVVNIYPLCFIQTGAYGKHFFYLSTTMGHSMALIFSKTGEFIQKIEYE